MKFVEKNRAVKQKKYNQWAGHLSAQLLHLLLLLLYQWRTERIWRPGRRWELAPPPLAC